jgi:hypothetical protein
MPYRVDYASVVSLDKLLISLPRLPLQHPHLNITATIPYTRASLQFQPGTVALFMKPWDSESQRVFSTLTAF